MHQIPLVGLLGTRESADDIIARAALPTNLAGEQVVLLCRDLLSGSTSFADQLIAVIVVGRNADALAVVGAPARFAQHLHDAAKRRGVSQRVRSESAAQLTS